MMTSNNFVYIIYMQVSCFVLILKLLALLLNKDYYFVLLISGSQHNFIVLKMFNLKAGTKCVCISDDE